MRQTDIFAAGETRSVPPHLDPAIVAAVECCPETDRDHVGDAEVGRFGNNSRCVVVKVLDRGGQAIYAERFDGPGMEQRAAARATALLREVQGNRQQEFFL